MECARLPTGSDTTIGAATCLRFDLARREGVRDGRRLHAARIRRAWDNPDVAFQLQPLSSDEEDTDADGGYEEGADDHQDDDDEYWIPSR